MAASASGGRSAGNCLSGRRLPHDPCKSEGEAARFLVGTLEARHANHFRVGHDQYEFTFDFGQFHPGQITDEDEPPPVRIVRIVMGPLFAKALLETLQRAVSEYEQLHGPIEQ